MIERGRRALRMSSLLALLCTAGCTLDTHATGTRGLADAEADGSALDFGPPTQSDASAVESGLDGATDAAPQMRMDAATDSDGGDGGADAADAGDAGEELVGDGGYPLLLSQTGLYQNILIDMTRGDVMAFQPRFALWSDAAVKRRWMRLPPGAQIDTSDMDAWVFPVGTKAWKEFRSNGIPVETRMLHKVAKDRWVMLAYRWRADQSDADALPAGEANALGTKHDIPDQTLCARCHNSQDALLGVSALQLSHDLPGQNLTSLTVSRRLSKPPVSSFKIPGGTLAENALGYLHANCGHCHRPGTAAHAQILKRPPKTGGPILWERTDALDSLERTVGYTSTVLQANSVLPDLHIIEPGYPEKSELVIRTGQRGVGTLQMPPVGTEAVDEAGLKQIKDWITSLKK